MSLFKKHRGTFTRLVEIAVNEIYSITANIPAAEDFNLAPKELFGKVVTGWSGTFQGDNPPPVELSADNFTPENWAEFVADPMIEGAVWRALGGLRSEALSGELARKNSSTSPAGMPTAAASTGASSES